MSTTTTPPGSFSVPSTDEQERIRKELGLSKTFHAPDLPVPESEPAPEPVIIDSPESEDFPIPSKESFLVTGEVMELLALVDNFTSQDKITNVLITGKQGIGKSALAEQYAATRRLPYAVIEVGRLSDPQQIFGGMVLEEGKTTYVPGIFTRAITTPYCVVHLQELNRPENDKALNALFSVLDPKQRRIWLDELGYSLQVAKGVTFFATLNEGFEFIGTLPLDEALRNRFQVKIDLKPLPEVEERKLLMARGLTQNKVHQLMDTVAKLRNNSQDPIDISTRDVVNMADLMEAGANPQLALVGVMGGGHDMIESVRLEAHLSGSILGGNHSDTWRQL